VPFDVAIGVELNAVADSVQALIPAEEVSVESVYRPVMGRFDLRRPRALEELLDAEYTRRHFANLRTSMAILAASLRREVWFLNSADFHYLSVRLDTHGAGTLEASTGDRALAPGEVWRGSATLTPVAR
jgi:hypothetical protein